jgi:cation diffusion facilitator CzcD-associated flavoprotein CzcO
MGTTFCIAEWRFLSYQERNSINSYRSYRSFFFDGILLKSGKALKADIITATGLDLLAFGGVKIQLDSQPFDISKSFVYKGLMLSDLPNFFFCWLYQCIMDVKSDLTSEYISRLLNYMNKHNYKALQSKVIETNLKPVPLLNLNSDILIEHLICFPARK